MAAAVAAIDCGTNSIRLLVARPEGDQLVDLDRLMTVVRLGEGVDRTGRLSDAALQRTFDACRQYRDVLASYDVDRLRFVATSASRDADNAEDFVLGVREILGVDPEVISGREEAGLSFLGATRGVDHRSPVLVFDIGGGSTEFVVGDGGRVRESLSVDMGCVRFHERYLSSGLSADPVAAAQLGELRAAVGSLMDRVLAELDISGVQDVIGLAGTVTTVAALSLGLPAYDADVIHGSRIPAAEVTRVADELAAMTLAERTGLGVMHPGRADVIVSGAAILDTIVQRLGVESIIASEHDILDGLVWGQLT